MSEYVFSFRGPAGTNPSAEEEAAWGRWFQEIGSSVADFGNRVGRTRVVGKRSAQDVLAGYVVVKAESLDAAGALAEGCPGLANGGVVEVGEVVEP